MSENSIKRTLKNQSKLRWSVWHLADVKNCQATFHYAFVFSLNNCLLISNFVNNNGHDNNNKLNCLLILMFMKKRDASIILRMLRIKTIFMLSKCVMNGDTKKW
jgi:hypothetical protein